VAAICHTPADADCFTVGSLGGHEKCVPRGARVVDLGFVVSLFKMLMRALNNW